MCVLNEACNFPEEKTPMENEKDRFGEKMRLVERAKEDIYFAAKDRELIEKLRAVLKKAEGSGGEGQPIPCPKCPGKLESCTFMEFLLDQCRSCGGIWLDSGELEGILRKASRSPLAALIERFIAKEDVAKPEGGRNETKREKV
jgi:Zn-finger nucleic acid-binding protein